MKDSPGSTVIQSGRLLAKALPTFIIARCDRTILKRGLLHVSGRESRIIYSKIIFHAGLTEASKENEGGTRIRLAASVASRRTGGSPLCVLSLAAARSPIAIKRFVFM